MKEMDKKLKDSTLNDELNGNLIQFPIEYKGKIKNFIFK